MKITNDILDNYNIEYRRYKIAKILNKKINKRFERLHIFCKHHLSDLKKYIDEDDNTVIIYGKSEKEIILAVSKNSLLLETKIFNKFRKKFYIKQDDYEINIKISILFNVYLGLNIELVSSFDFQQEDVFESNLIKNP